VLIVAVRTFGRAHDEFVKAEANKRQKSREAVSMRRLVSVAFAVAVLLIFEAQSVLCADLIGSVTDTQGHPVANAKILVKNLTNSVVSEGRSNAKGRYRLTGLKSGTYDYMIDPAGSGLKGGNGAGYLCTKELTIDWRVSDTKPATASARDCVKMAPPGDPFGFSALAFTGILAGSGAVVGGTAAGAYAAAGGFSSSSSHRSPAGTSDCDQRPLPNQCKHPNSDKQ
jgi:hypothetical protein